MRGPLYSRAAGRGCAGREVCAGVLLAQPRAMARRGRGACACTPRCPLLPKRGPVVAQGRQACGSGGCID